MIAFRQQILALGLAVTLGAVAGWGQATSVRGVVTDAAGSVVPGSVITLTNKATSASRQSITDETGVYQFLQTAPGAYEMKAEKPGFRTMLNSTVVVQVSTPATLDFALEIGSVSESVN